MIFPSNSDYVNVVKNIKSYITDNYLKDAKIIPKKNGIGVLSYSGGFSKVFPVIIDNYKIALRFWTTDIGNSKDIYKEIDIYLKSKKLSYFVDFHYIEDKLTWNGKNYPFVYMDWIDGLTLDKYIDNNIKNSKKIKQLADNFLEMVKILHQNNIAHGDLQDQNILVIENGNNIELKLIDYDSMYVPNLKGFNLTIEGVKGFQHPKKNDLKKINYKIDYFSELIIYLSILAYSENSNLWIQRREQELLFSPKDFQDPLNSNIFATLNDKKYSKILHKLRDKLIMFSQETDILKLQPLEKLVYSEIEDKEINLAYEKFKNQLEDKDEKIAQEIESFLIDSTYKKEAKNKILSYLYFLINIDNYLLPNNYKDLLKDDFSFLENIYSLYKLQELKDIGNLISLKNIINLAKDGSFEEQKYIQELYYLEDKILPLDFIIELENNFFKTLKNINLYIREDLFKKVLEKSILSEDETNNHIMTLKNSSNILYEKNYKNILIDIKSYYILPIDYNQLTKNKSSSINYIIYNCYTVKEIEQIGKNLSINNIMSSMQQGQFSEQMTIEKLKEIKNRYVPIDFNKELQRDLFKSITHIKSYLTKKELKNILQKFNLDTTEINNYNNILKKSTLKKYQDNLNLIKYNIFNINDYSDNIQKYYIKLSINKPLSNDYIFINFLKKEIIKENKFIVLYKVLSFIIFLSIFFINLEAVFIMSAFTTITFISSVRKRDKIPEKFTKQNKIFLNDNNLFSKTFLKKYIYLIVFNITFMASISFFGS